MGNLSIFYYKYQSFSIQSMTCRANHQFRLNILNETIDFIWINCRSSDSYTHTFKKMEIAGKVALVTGAATGLGRAFCEELLRYGAKVSEIK